MAGKKRDNDEPRRWVRLHDCEILTCTDKAARIVIRCKNQAGVTCWCPKSVMRYEQPNEPVKKPPTWIVAEWFFAKSIKRGPGDVPETYGELIEADEIGVTVDGIVGAYCTQSGWSGRKCSRANSEPTPVDEGPTREQLRGINEKLILVLDHVRAVIIHVTEFRAEFWVKTTISEIDEALDEAKRYL
jgi:hypothetical protein